MLGKDAFVIRKGTGHKAEYQTKKSRAGRFCYESNPGTRTDTVRMKPRQKQQKKKKNPNRRGGNEQDPYRRKGNEGDKREKWEKIGGSREVLCYGPRIHRKDCGSS